jgi:hypothetical protein
MLLATTAPQSESPTTNGSYVAISLEPPRLRTPSLSPLARKALLYPTRAAAVIVEGFVAHHDEAAGETGRHPGEVVAAIERAEVESAIIPIRN